jgi:hypothetical protein
MRNYLSILLISLIFLGHVGDSYGQTYQYGWSYFPNAGNPNGINTEGDAPGLNAWTNIFTGGTSTNVWSDVVAIPFPFEFYGSTVTHLKASANGIVTFDTASTSLPNTTELLPSTALPAQSIACFWDEFTNLPPIATSDDIRFKVLGTAPNRQLWVKWYSFEMGNPAIGFGYWAAVLEETSNKIYIVDQYSSTDVNATENLNASVGLQNSLTEFTQATGNFVDFDGNGTSIEDNDFYEFFLMDSLNVELVAITEPSGSICPGTYGIELAVRNVGFTPITSLTIAVSLNNGPATLIPFTSLNILPNEFDTISLGNQTFASGQLYDFDIYATLVNGILDNDQSNDSIIIVGAQTGLVGNYTIDLNSPTSGSNYNSFSEAAQDLNDWGVCGAVVFDIADGIYEDSVYLGEIAGASAINTITFDGGNAMDARLRYDGAGVEAVWQMEGTDHLIIKNITFENTKTTTDAWNIHLSKGADSNVIDSCRFILPVGTTLDVQHIVASDNLTFETSSGNNANYLTVTNSYFRGGETGIHIEGDGGGTAFTYGYVISHNTFRQHDDEAFDCDDIQDLVMIGNNVDSISESNADGFYLLDVNDYHIEENYIHVPDWGIYVLDGNDLFVSSQRSTVTNNMIISDADYAVYLNDFEITDVFHNTLKGNPALGINDQTNTNIRNNIFTGENGLAFRSFDDLTGGDVVNYNVYGATGSANLVQVGTPAYVDLVAWQTASPAYNLNSIEGIPLYVGAYDLHVLDLLANNVGDNSVGVTVDIDGDSRPASTTVDIGADEYTPISNDISVLQILSPTGIVCEDSLQFIELVIQNAGLNAQDSVPFTIELIQGTTTSWMDTLYPSLAAFTIDTITLGPINTFGFNNALLNIYAMLSIDEVTANDTISDSLNISTLPVAVGVTDDVLCSAADTALLVANGALDQIRWYETATSDSIIFIGDTFISPITGPVSYWVSQVAATIGLVGAPSDSIGTAANFTAITAQYMEFDVIGSMSLDSLTVYPNDTGNVQVILQDNNGLGLDTVTTLVQPIASGAAVRIAIGFEIEPGSYRLAAGSGTTTGGLRRNSSGASYPYTLPGVVSITGNSFSSSSYYFFYNWQVSSFGCEGERTEVKGYIDSTTVELPADITICPGVNTLIEPLEVGFNYTSYLWSDGSTDSTFITNEAEVVAVTVTSVYGCEVSDEMVVDTHALAPVSIGNDTAFCEGEDFEVTFTASNGFIQYFWSNAAQTQSITIDYAATFTVSVTDNNGCEQTASATISINPLPIANGGPDTLICEGETYTLPLQAGLDAAWTNSAGDTVTAADMAGDYVLSVTDLNGCSAFDTIMVNTQDCDTTTGILSLNGMPFNVYPNPSNGLITVSFNKTTEQLGFKVFDVVGNLVWTKDIAQNSQYQLDLNGLAKGYYMLQIGQGEDIVVHRIILQ